MSISDDLRLLADPAESRDGRSAARSAAVSSVAVAGSSSLGAWAAAASFFVRFCLRLRCILAPISSSSDSLQTPAADTAARAFGVLVCCLGFCCCCCFAGLAPTTRTPGSLPPSLRSSPSSSESPTFQNLRGFSRLRLPPLFSLFVVSAEAADGSLTSPPLPPADRRERP
ncbi:hypothetical protein BC831DRAFT_486993 [Entophlyctis helioformis]|nr:hypothetical protein BC831DRAFT_486993 [Entophlyctis helioformis]